MTLFEEKAPGIMRLLMADFGFTAEEAAAVIGNGGHESGGFKFLQEKKPMVPGSAGGYGWFQWTGPRRRAYEAYCSRNKLDPAGDKANYGYLWVELHGDEKSAVPKVKAASGLRAKVEAFEVAFERAGVKHYDSREKYARLALAAYIREEAAGASQKPVEAQEAPKAIIIAKTTDKPPTASPAPSRGFFGTLAGFFKRKEPS